MRLMSFSMTTEAYRDYWKDVTRRDGWWFLKPGDVLMGVEKGMGLRKGEKVKRIHPLRVVSTRPEPLSALILDEDYGAEEMPREGFPGTLPADFCVMYIGHNGGSVDEVRNRIEFEHECPRCHGTGIRSDSPLDDGRCGACSGGGWVKGRALTETWEGALS